MLRRVLLIVTGLVVLGGGLCLALGLFAPGLVGLSVWCAAALVALAIERWRYKAVLTAPPQGEDWADTGERMIDPTSRRRLGVWCHATTGERAYVDVGAASDPAAPRTPAPAGTAVAADTAET